MINLGVQPKKLSHLEEKHDSKKVSPYPTRYQEDPSTLIPPKVAHIYSQEQPSQAQFMSQGAPIAETPQAETAPLSISIPMAETPVIPQPQVQVPADNVTFMFVLNHQENRRVIMNCPPNISLAELRRLKAFIELQICPEAFEQRSPE